VGPVSDDVLSRFGLERPRTLRRHSFVSLSARRTPARRKRCIARNCGPVLKTRREGNGRHLQGAPETSEPPTLPPRLVRTKQSAEMTPMRFGLDQGKSGWSFGGLEPLTSSMPWWPAKRRRRAASVDEVPGRTSAATSVRSGRPSVCPSRLERRPMRPGPPFSACAAGASSSQVVLSCSDMTI
jgi:hypothetical protein